MYESLLPKDELRIEPVFAFGNLEDGMVAGPMTSRDYANFLPAPVDTSNVSLLVHSKITMTCNTVPYYIVTALVPTQKYPCRYFNRVAV